MNARHMLTRAASSPLVEDLDRSFYGGADAEADLVASIPPALWDRALLDPLRDFLSRPSKEFRSRLLELGYQIGGGGDEGCPVELTTMIESLHAGSLIIDDIEDDSEERRGAPAVHRRHGLPVALNAGSWLFFWAQSMILRLPLGDGARLAAHERTIACLLRCHQGQALDLTVRADALAQAEVPAVVRILTTLKTGSLLGLAASLGALAAGARGERLEAIGAFGRTIGIALQMLDDLSGIVNVRRRHKAIEDVRLGRATWTWAWLAEDLAADVYDRLREELAGVGDDAAADALVERVRFRLGGKGLERARREIEAATDELRARVGAGPWSDVVDTEFARLERRYVEG